MKKIPEQPQPKPEKALSAPSLAEYERMLLRQAVAALDN